ncbi:hypothetical protein E4U30_005964 [Claviceps sp. LM220 group G6]|nr:hypothetical protein E4U32_007739 [Claviceps aff. humidiphila group G2b]KAG6102487.1 hypothetical protein E4U30_005964 [Claviceps sp. LM220 group G6]KAG6104167.1 hypothetical protein E4U31_002190 [Claviceps sp. LM219 group G6]
MNYFFKARPDTSWVSAGSASTFPDLGEDLGNLIEARQCNALMRPGCKIFHVPKDDPSLAKEIVISATDLESPSSGDELLNQVVVFQYRGKFHAVDHRCPHSAYPLSNGMPFDIEDFGVKLSAGLTCPKHGWSFDLFTGMADTGRYKLPVWEVQLRDAAGVNVVDPSRGDDHPEERTVWIRRKQRMG